MENQPTETDKRTGVIWSQGKWRCELHESDEGMWRFHLFRGDELLATRAMAAGSCFDRAEALRQCISLRESLAEDPSSVS